ncbi:hypothetical protein [Bacillus thuringiensis]|uniref:hypothetical protein n=1 Tax=Bacillus thuringiensis TaxID=1428 RepID=UPI00103F2F64|nr:hypothetical protein [Bacillus thuringiensis]TBX38910.1 hypothetical protein E0M35_28405 [Bacillus thuringiensis]
MNNNVLYDITTYDLKGLCTHFDIEELDILDFFNATALKGIQSNAESFLKYFKIDSARVLEKEIYLTSLHVTTVNDQLDSIKKFGLVNLQQAVTLETPLQKYLLNKGVSIDIKRKVIVYNGKIIDIGKRFTSVHDNLDWVIFKLFKDYPITSFFTTDDATKYPGKVHERPEFLKNLSKLLDAPDINDDWKEKNYCYVLKFQSHLSNFDCMSFGSVKSDDQELEKRIWIIDKVLENQRYGYEETCFSHLKGHVSIPFQDIKTIYTLDEYKNAYHVK